MADEEKITILETVDDESEAWDIAEYYTVTDRAIFSRESPHTFGVKTLRSWHGEAYAIYLKKNDAGEED